jgi:hypothetical protein
MSAQPAQRQEAECESAVTSGPGAVRRGPDAGSITSGVWHSELLPLRARLTAHADHFNLEQH